MKKEISLPRICNPFTALTAFVLVSVSGSYAGITTIEELDKAKVFSFAIMSDNKGFGAEGTNPNNVITKKFVDWVSANDEFCLGVGDHFTTSSAERLKFRDVMEKNTYFHNNFYPIAGDHDNETQLFYGTIGSDTDWGRGWVIFKMLNNFFERPEVEFRPKQSAKVLSGGKYYDDQLVDYYAKRSKGGFTVHVLGLHYGDHSAFALPTKNFMISKLKTLAATKTDRDIIVVLAHSIDKFFLNAIAGKYMTQSEADLVMNTADLVCDASVHKFWRHRDYDGKYDGNEALWINTGVLDVASTCLAGYVNIHVFDNPPRFTMQWIETENVIKRRLHIGPVKHSDNILDIETVPMVKYVNGPFKQVDWSKFNSTVSTLPWMVVKGGKTLSSTFKVAGERFELPSGFAGKPTKCSIYDIQGRMMRSAELKATEVVYFKDYALSSGAYIVRLRTLE
jgi:hypothetical protein